MQRVEVNNKDHNYSEVKSHNSKIECNANESDARPACKSNKSGLATNKETFGQIKNINELKKITPRVKLLSHDANSLNELTRISLHNKQSAQRKPSITERTREELKKYCRTCAGLKVPLVDIFSEKGNQMRLSQQIKHLEEINPYDSLSTQMCMDCICDLKMSYKFFMQIKKAEVKLKSIHFALTDTVAKNAVASKVHATGTPEKQIETVVLLDKVSPSTSKENEKPTALNASAAKKLEQVEQVKQVEQVEQVVQVEQVKKQVSTTVSNEEKTTVEPEQLNFKKEAKIFEDAVINISSDDNDSIEEFDPDDPPFQPDTSDAAESDDEVVEPNAKRRYIQSKENTKSFVFVSDNNFVLGNKISDPNQGSYRYDSTLKRYVKVEKSDGNDCVAAKHGIVKSEFETAKEPKQPNILKRRLLSQSKKESTEEVENDSDKNCKDFKVQKLNVNNSLNLHNNQEDGIMYVTVKGSKPNELLLVKVKKMDKPLDKKDDKLVVKKGFDIAPVEKILKRYETLVTKEKDLFPERTKKAEMREQIIEEQIEEYKKKREKVLGGHNSISESLKLEESQSRYFKRNETQDKQKPTAKVESDSAVCETMQDESQCDNSIITIESDVSESVESAKEQSPKEQLDTNTEEYSPHLSKAKPKCEEAKKKKETLQRELNESYTEGNLEKLARILGEKEKNLQDFQDYLKQRKIVITRLKDEDIISLYEDRNNSIFKNNLPDLIDESHPVDYIPEEHYLECDYCPQTFASKEVLEEHLKRHDYKIMHFCEDCMEEFPTNKAKRSHNVICIKKLLCRYCGIMLDSKGKKRQHEQKHYDSMFGQLCDVCGEKFKHQSTLDQHVKTQHMSWEKIYQCPKCPKKFAFKQKLSFHLKSVHTTLRAYLCEDCGADFKNPASLRHHRIRKHQPVGNKRECQVCHKLVPFYSLSKHMHTHKAYTIQCPHCDKMFKNSSTLKQHVRIHEDQRQYRCDTCGVGFNRRDGLRLHMRVHEKSDSRGLKECSCQVCGEKFPNQSTLVIHRNRVHKDGRQYTCQICNRSMISTRSLEWHMSHIHNEALPKEDIDGSSMEKKRASCHHCNKTFKTEMILRTHIKNTHMEKDPMKCLDCELTFTSEVRLRHHMMVTHNRLEGTLPCPHCPKRFVNQLRLKTHMISHSEERPYTCEICGFNLKTKIQLLKHHQNRHSDERPLQCRYCPWRCKQVSALVCHERTHTNERPYSCSVCRQRFKYLGDKNKHERRHESLGGSGFKRIVLGRNIKSKVRQDSSCSDQDQEALSNAEVQAVEGEYQEETSEQAFEEEQIVKFEEQEMKFEEQEIKFEQQEIAEEYEQVYEQEYEETSREASDAAEVIMNMEDTVYTEEVTTDNIEPAEIIADEIMTNEILQSGAVVHLQQEDDSGKIQVIPVMLSLPDLSETNTEVNLATASIMYNN